MSACWQFRKADWFFYTIAEAKRKAIGGSRKYNAYKINLNIKQKRPDSFIDMLKSYGIRIMKGASLSVHFMIDLTS